MKFVKVKRLNVVHRLELRLKRQKELQETPDCGKAWVQIVNT